MNVWKYQELVLKNTWKVHSRLKIYLLLKNTKKLLIQVKDLLKVSSILLLFNTETRAIEEKIVVFENRCNCEVYFFDHTGFKEGVIIILSLESNEVTAFIRSDNIGDSVFRSFFFEFKER